MPDTDNKHISTKEAVVDIGAVPSTDQYDYHDQQYDLGNIVGIFGTYAVIYSTRITSFTECEGNGNEYERSARVYCLRYEDGQEFECEQSDLDPNKTIPSQDVDTLWRLKMMALYSRARSEGAEGEFTMTARAHAGLNAKQLKIEFNCEIGHWDCRGEFKSGDSDRSFYTAHQRHQENKRHQVKLISAS